MDPKTLLFLWLAFVSFGGTVSSILKVSGLTKTAVVEGGKVTLVVALLASVASLVGWALFLIVVFLYGDTARRAIECVLG